MDLNTAKNILKNRFCMLDGYCPECPYEGSGNCYENISDDEIILLAMSILGEKAVKYSFDPERAFETIKTQTLDWFKANKLNPVFVIGISGGKDSTVAAYLASRIAGPENVYGVLMPNEHQYDIADSEEVCKNLGIRSLTVNIGEAFNSIYNSVYYTLNGKYNEQNFTDTRINLPPRLRMATLYAVAQAVGGIVVNTCNLSERDLGFATIYGDFAGSFSFLQDLTVTEVVALGKWLGIPKNLVEKVPSDGLQSATDEEKLGIKYADLDRFIRLNEGSEAFKVKVLDKYRRNRFKLGLINIPGVSFGFTDFVREIGDNN